MKQRETLRLCSAPPLCSQTLGVSFSFSHLYLPANTRSNTKFSCHLRLLQGDLCQISKPCSQLVGNCSIIQRSREIHARLSPSLKVILCWYKTVFQGGHILLIFWMMAWQGTCGGSHKIAFHAHNLGLAFSHKRPLSFRSRKLVSEFSIQQRGRCQWQIYSVFVLQTHPASLQTLSF